MNEAQAQDWLLPRLLKLLAEADRAGIAPDMAATAITTLITGPAFTRRGVQAEE